MIVAGPMAEPLLGMSALLRMNVEMRDGKIVALPRPFDVTDCCALVLVAKPRERANGLGIA